ncbi:MULTISPECIES: NAD-dependent epimerase/dehydratase family protein [unclassified Streptomyces]|uniref:NAD-dependent epimerase/dehydratase family protein n=1 Tax=unclassified Streptomyces TaxID=2593676 RepID=UPI0036E4FA69
MRVVIFGASGMVGHGALRACLLDERVEEVLVVTRRPLNVDHPKVREIIHTDFTEYTAILDELKGLDACFFCLGVSAAGHSEEEYTRITHDYTLAAARAVSAAGASPAFLYVSGEGTDSTEQGRAMWARVKGRTENELLAMPFRAYMFRPAYIQPVNGAAPRTRLYRVIYGVTAWLYPALRRIAPGYVTTTDTVGRAMLAAVLLDDGGPFVLRTPDINRLGAA